MLDARFSYEIQLEQLEIRLHGCLCTDAEGPGLKSTDTANREQVQSWPHRLAPRSGADDSSRRVETFPVLCHFPALVMGTSLT